MITEKYLKREIRHIKFGIYKVHSNLTDMNDPDKAVKNLEKVIERIKFLEKMLYNGSGRWL